MRDLVVAWHFWGSVPRLTVWGKQMRIRLSYIAALLSIAFVSTANASLIGSTYDFTTFAAGNVQISPLGGPTTHTDPANPSFCVGPPLNCGLGLPLTGLSGSISFLPFMGDPNFTVIRFSFAGQTLIGDGLFRITLGNFVTLDGSTITSMGEPFGSLGGTSNLLSGLLADGSLFFNWQTVLGFATTGAGENVNFLVRTDAAPVNAVPLPAALPLFATGLGAMGLFGWWRKRKPQAA